MPKTLLLCTALALTLTLAAQAEEKLSCPKLIKMNVQGSTDRYSLSCQQTLTPESANPFKLEFEQVTITGGDNPTMICEYKTFYAELTTQLTGLTNCKVPEGSKARKLANGQDAVTCTLPWCEVTCEATSSSKTISRR